MNTFLTDPHLSFNGYQTNFGNLNEGIFFFTHNVDNCGSTMGLKVRNFTSLYSGPRYTTSKQLSSDCPRYCLDKGNLDRCSAKCENAFARELSQIIKDIMTCQQAPDEVYPEPQLLPKVSQIQ